MSVRRLLAVFLFYLLLTVAMTWPLAWAPGSYVPSDVGDPLLNTWIAWWNASTMPMTAAWWNAPAFHPSRDVLALSEHLLGLSWITSPVQWLGASPLAAYNVAFLASWVLGGVAGWLLGYELTGRADAALVGSAVFAFAPYRASQLSHVQVLSAYWMPVALMALHRYARTGAWRWLGVFACAWFVQGLSNGYFLVFFGVLAAAWTVWFTAVRGRTARLAGITCATGLVLAASLPLLLHYRDVHERYGFGRSLEEISGYSADIVGVADASPHLWAWGGLRVFHRPEGELFPGLAVLLVIAAGVVLGPSAIGRRRWQRAARATVALGLLMAIAGCLSYAVLGGWKASWLGIEVSVRDPMRPLALAVVLALTLVVTRPGIRTAIAGRSRLLFYLAAAVALWVCALGPAPTFVGEPIGLRSPYAWLAAVPGFAGFRVPARFWMLSVVCLSAAASLAFARWPLPGRWRTRAAAVAVALIVAEGWVAPFPLLPAPEPWPPILQPRSSVPVLQLPAVRETLAMYRGVVASRPIVNGYSGYFPPAHRILVQATQMTDLSVLDGIARLGALEIMLDRYEDQGRRLARALGPAGATPRAHVDRWSLWERPTAPPTPRVPDLAREHRPRAAHATINEDLAGGVADGRIDTRWYTSVQRPGHQITLDFGRPVAAAAIRLLLGSWPLDYPKALDVDRSVDGAVWTRTWSGPTAALAWLGAVKSPRVVPITIPLDGCDARYLRLALTAESPVHGWSIAEATLVEAQPGHCSSATGNR